MLVVETIARIRREHFVKGKTIKEIARDLGISRNTVLDRLSPARRRLAKRSRFEMSASAPVVTGLPGRERALADRKRSFACEGSGAILRGCPDHARAWAFCLTIYTSSRSPGRASGARPSTMLRRGPSPTTGPT